MVVVHTCEAPQFGAPNVAVSGTMPFVPAVEVQELAWKLLPSSFGGRYDMFTVAKSVMLPPPRQTSCPSPSLRQPGPASPNGKNVPQFSPAGASELHPKVHETSVVDGSTFSTVATKVVELVEPA